MGSPAKPARAASFPTSSSGSLIWIRFLLLSLWANMPSSRRRSLLLCVVSSSLRVDCSLASVAPSPSFFPTSTSVYQREIVVSSPKGAAPGLLISMPTEVSLAMVACQALSLTSRVW
eukprot:scaffold1290_cov367-Prasinococcus_capsulatus_cf.AAC.3